MIGLKSESRASMGNKRRLARQRDHQVRLAQEEEADQKKAVAAEKRNVRRSKNLENRRCKSVAPCIGTRPAQRI